jgi:hypothetical protein
LVSIVILGIIAAPLAGVILGFFKNSDATARRMNESHDAQIVAAFFAQDVQSMGVHDYLNPTILNKPFKQSVETGVVGTGDFACGPPAAVVRLAWDDWESVPTDVNALPTRVQVAYVVENVTELHRLVCRGSATPTADAIVAHNVVAASVACVTSSGGASCTGSDPDVPTTVSLQLTIRDPKSIANYSVTLTGQRRQTP